MTRDEVIALARETKLIKFESLSWNPEAQSPNPESLAAVWKLCELAAAAEREACARVCEQYAEHQLQWRNERPAEFRAMGANEAAEAIRARGAYET